MDSCSFFFHFFCLHSELQEETLLQMVHLKAETISNLELPIAGLPSALSETSEIQNKSTELKISELLWIYTRAVWMAPSTKGLAPLYT